MSFEGRFDTDEFEGEGKLKWKDGRSYEGGFSRSKFHGKGRLSTPSNTISGDFFEGKLTKVFDSKFSNGDEYSGDVQDNLPHGKGSYDYKSGNSYKGEFVFGKKHDSAASLTFGTEGLKGCTYNGAFVNDKMSDKGTISSSDLKIEGTFVDNYLNGKAKVMRKYIGTLEGEYEDNMKHGDFVFTREDSKKQCKTFFQYDVEDTSVHKLASRF